MKNKFSRILISMTVTLAIISSSLVGCGTGSTSQSTNNNETSTNTGNSSNLSAQDPITVTFWHYYGGDVEKLFNSMVTEFNTTIGASEGIIVESISKNNLMQLEDDVSKAAAGVVYADSFPNMLLIYADKALELMEDDMLTDLGQYITDDELSAFPESFLEDGYLNEQQIIMPIAKSSELIYINDTSWREFASATGYTYSDLTTWEDITEVSKAYYQYTDELTPDILNDGKGFMSIDSVSNYVTISAAQLGENIFDAEDEKAIINSATLRKSFDMYVTNMSLGYFNKIGKFSSDDIRSGDIIAFAGSSASAPFFPNWIELDGSQVDIEWRALPYPRFEEGENLVISQGAGISVTKSDAKTEEACATFIKFLLEPSRNIQFTLQNAYIPVVNEFFNEENLNLSLEILSENKIYENLEEIYNLVFDRISDDGLYNATAFIGSFNIRDSLNDNLVNIAALSKEKALEYRKNNISDEEIIDLIQLDKQFEEYLSVVKAELQRQNIDFE